MGFKTEILPVRTMPDGRKVLENNDRAVFPVSRNDVDYIRSTLRTGKEIGGTFVPDIHGVLHRYTTTAFGHTNDVEIPHGTFEWHTHPQKCGMTDCSLSSPSDTDVGIILNDVKSENVSHMVFNHAGVFVMTLSPSLVLHLLKGGSKAAKAIEKKFTKLQDQFAQKYNRTRDVASKDRAEQWHQDEWMRLAKANGILVSFWTYDRVPEVRL